MSVCVYYGEALARYGFGQGHPFGPDRLEAFWRQLVQQELNHSVITCTPVMCSDDDLLLFHTPDYIAQVKQQSESGEGYLDSGDTPAFKGVYEAASFVVGSVLDALEKILHGGCTRAFVPIAGLHHAYRHRAKGFCVFNDIGVGIEWLRRRHNIHRIAYVDIDAHHGDGVFYSFESDPDLIFADFHEDGHYLYPGTGAVTETGKGAAVGTKLNIPMPPRADDRLFFEIWPQIEIFIRNAEPEIILLQAGADSIAGDPITHMAYSPDVHAHATRQLCLLANEFCQGRLLATGGGGYHRGNLARAWTAVVKSLIEAEAP
ncbi:MAG: acetoin utilization protein AcuC [Gammaproteobacteria bacterium]|nr:acetoin utilization protein AcuC [Gammaproteobacteria bacterium]